MPSREPLQSGLSNGATYVATVDGPVTRRILETTGRAEYTATAQLVFQRQTTLFAQRFDPARLELMGDPSPIADQIPDNAWSVSDAGTIIYRTVLLDLDRNGNSFGLTASVRRWNKSVIARSM